MYIATHILLKMVSVNDAKQKVIANTALLPAETRKLTDSSGYISASSIYSALSLPSFRQSSMDGFAVCHEDINEMGIILPVVAESKAGSGPGKVLPRGTAVRIFTGAPVPDGATAVVMQEHTQVRLGSVVINEYPLSEGKNIRKVGQQIKQGDVAIPEGTLLSPGAIGFLTGLNITEVLVYRKPKVGILVTGDELIKPGSALEYGQVYESNSSMLIAALSKESIREIEVRYASDDLPSTIEALKLLAASNDVILASGGISVGDYDFVGEALEAIGAETIFYKIKQKPGKPLLFATKKEKLFFALPGNPASSLVCYYEYVLPAIRRMTGYRECFLRKIRLSCASRYSFNGERDEFLKAFAMDDEVFLLDGQESFVLSSFATANALVYLPATQQVVEKGDMVEVHLLPLGT